MRLHYVPLQELLSQQMEGNPKAHDIAGIIDSIVRFGFNDPVVRSVYDGEIVIVEGHGRVLAMDQLSRENGLIALPQNIKRGQNGEILIPVIDIELPPEEAKAYVLAHNKLTENGGWDNALLAQALSEIAEVDSGLLEVTGFSEDEILDLLPSLQVDDLAAMSADDVFLDSGTFEEDAGSEEDSGMEVVSQTAEPQKVGGVVPFVFGAHRTPVAKELYERFKEQLEAYNGNIVAWLRAKLED